MADSKKDDHGQPVNTAFNFKRNAEKAVYALRGILQGLNADAELNEQELRFLDIWLRDQKQISDNGDVVDLIDIIDNILEDGLVEAHELDELKALIDDIIEYGQQSTSEVEASINELLGLLLGLSSDGVINFHEFVVLEDWITRNKHIASYWPTSELVKRIELITADNVVTSEEMDDLLVTVKQLSGQHFEETGAADGGVAEIFSDVMNGFAHMNKALCFTGRFVCGTRKEVESRAIKLGATVQSSVNAKLDALVVGTLASRDWRFTSHGRKIERALELREEVGQPIILCERQWLSYL